MQKDKIKDAYHDSKSFYDRVLTQDNILSKAYMKLFWGGTDDVAIAHQMLAYIPEGFSGTILDVPCGTLVFTSTQWKRLNNAKIFCLDYSEDMLRQAQKRIEGYSHITLQQGDVGALPYEAQSIDLVMSMNGFHAFPDKLKAFDETCRVLKKGGKFIFSFYVQGKLRRADWLVSHILAPKGWFTAPFQTEEEVRQILTEKYTKVEIHTDNAMIWGMCEK